MLERNSIDAISPSTKRWQFWIDVGGTFTDCLAIGPEDQSLDASHQVKVLSSGLIKGRCEIRDGRYFMEANFGDQFWAGARLKVIEDSAESLHQATITSYDDLTGEVELEWASCDVANELDSFGCELDFGIPAPILAIRKILKLAPRRLLPDCDVNLGTTRGTNALLTRRGARTAIVTTKGFKDLLLIGDQARPHLFELTIRKPAPIFEMAIEVDERILADGIVEVPLNHQQTTDQLKELKAMGIESVAICLMHGFRYPQHEQQIGEIARELGFSSIRISSNVAPLIKILSRSETTVLDAYLNPVLGDYLDEIESSLSPNSQLQLMTSSGGFVRRSQFSGKDSVLSGPAGGIVGAARVAEQAGFPNTLTFDMGGTSTDVGRYDGEIELEFETRKSDVRIMTPMVAIETVAAGGGSICWFDGTRLMVGPQSAGSDPGPACYGRGGPLAVTDLNLYLGRIVQDHFPFLLDEAAVETRLQEISSAMAQSGFEMTPQKLAAGFLAIANQNMAAAIRSVSIARGYDPREYLLVAFGGAGPQHCCAVADAIGIKKVLDHPQSSILSAVGIRLADQTVNQARSVLQPLENSTLDGIESLWREMETVIEKQFVGRKPQLSRSLDLRYQGTESAQTVAVGDQPDLKSLKSDFAKTHQQIFGFTMNRPLEVAAARVIGRTLGTRLPPAHGTTTTKAEQCSPESKQLMWLDSSNSKTQTNVYARESISCGDCIVGPALVASSLSTTVVDDGWTATVLEQGQLLLEKVEFSAAPDRVSQTSIETKSGTFDPVQLEIFNSHFSSIARQMGISLQKTSMSVNVKERLDFSCAIFGTAGDLVVNAPHIPVHLGAMSETVRAIIRLNETVEPGDVFVTNDPFAGGSHLPDVTVVTPVFENQRLLFWVASRSHHSEIGGISPGSMPPNATNLAEEGVLIRNFKLIEGQTQTEHFDSLFELLTAPPYPSRSPQENLADIRAQVAANRTGERDLLNLVERYSAEFVLVYTEHIQAAAELKVRQSIASMKDGTYAFEDSLDNDATIRVSLRIEKDTMTIDFSGTDQVLKGNLNANPAIVSSAVIYVMRCLIDQDIPLNEGVMRPVTLKLPECFLNPSSHDDPARCPAVVGGNVETSQRIVDVLIGAIQPSVAGGIAAASQGTMNNWLMGDATFGYYETVGGGSGATPAGVGADAVHTHMTNTRLTDPEILETRYPAVLREFSIRNGSGGKGVHRGGDGMIREIEFRTPLTVSLLTNRRTKPPYGLLGGSAGETGVNELIRSDGSRENLPNHCELKVKPGERLRIETPGGGGWKPDETTSKNTQS